MPCTMLLLLLLLLLPVPDWGKEQQARRGSSREGLKKNPPGPSSCRNRVLFLMVLRASSSHVDLGEGENYIKKKYTSFLFNSSSGRTDGEERVQDTRERCTIHAKSRVRLKHRPHLSNDGIPRKRSQYWHGECLAGERSSRLGEGGAVRA